MGGPPGFSRAVERDSEVLMEFMFSLSSCGPRSAGSCAPGVCGVEVCWSDSERFSLLGEIRLRCWRGPATWKYKSMRGTSMMCFKGHQYQQYISWTFSVIPEAEGVPGLGRAGSPIRKPGR